MRVIALLATYNEERFISGCIEHLCRQGVESYIVDNESTDSTPALAGAYLGRGLVGIESFPRDGVYRWERLLHRKEELAAQLEADWFLHVDADERHLSPRPGVSLVDALAEADRQGYNAVNFHEFTFIPTAEAPDHDHPEFERTMRSYYPFEPTFPRLIRAWKKQPGPVDLAAAAGHRVSFPGLRLCPEPFKMRHYLFLSKRHLAEKYGRRAFDPAELRRGWHRWRSQVGAGGLDFPPRSHLRQYTTDEDLDPVSPWKRHWADEALEAHPARRFFLKPGYAHRPRPDYFADTLEDESSVVHQPDVYPLAAHLGRAFACDHVLDVGCGRAMKLAALHPEFAVTGVDYGDNLAFCHARYSFGRWVEADLESAVPHLDAAVLGRTVVVCADVVEHLIDPTALLRGLRQWMTDAPVAVISTPERDLVRGPLDLGPPANPHHVRAWNQTEFDQLLRWHGLNVIATGLTANNDRDRQLKTAVAVIGTTGTPAPDWLPNALPGIQVIRGAGSPGS